MHDQGFNAGQHAFILLFLKNGAGLHIGEVTAKDPGAIQTMLKVGNSLCVHLQSLHTCIQSLCAYSLRVQSLCRVQPVTIVQY